MSTLLSAKLDTDYYAAEPLEVKGNVQDGNTMHILSSLLLSTLTEVQADKCLSAGKKITDYLGELSPDERSELISNTQVQHYLHRLVQHAEKTATQSEIIEKIAEYFPSKVAYFKGKTLPYSYSYSDKEPSDSESIMTDSRRTAGCHSHLFHYRANALAATFRGPQLKLEDIRRASTAVAAEVTKLEKTMNSKDIAPPKRSYSVGVHDKTPPTRLLRLVRSPKKSMAEIPMLVPVLRSELSDPHFRASKSGASLFPPKRQRSPLPLQTAPVSVNGVPLLNAFDVIEAFASGQLESEAESVYLNFSHSDRCSPYDLTVTLRTKVEPEHFVISNFGIIHVYPDGMSDFQSFADWLREASMFTLMRQIPFFKEFKLKRTLWQWHKAVNSTKFVRLTLKIDRICIRFFPLYADALLKLQHLSEELMTISFHDLKPLGSYTVDAMEHSLQGSQTKAHHFLLKYFKYCRRIVCETINSSRKHASDLETEHHHQPFVPEVPLSIQRKRHEMLERDLKTATYQGERVADFIFLTEQLVYNCLLQLAQRNADSWKSVFLSPIPKQASSGFQIPMPSHRKNIGADKSRQSEQNQDNYFLLSSLEINDDSGELVTEPKSSQIKGLFCTFFSDISDIISATVHQLDVPPQEKEKVLTRGSTRDSHTASPKMQPSEPGNKQNSLSSNSCKDLKKRFHDIPPSLVPVRQKSVVKALRGIPLITHNLVSFSLGEQTLASQAEQNLQGLTQQSETARDIVPDRRNSVLHKDVFAEMLQNDEYIQHVLKEVETATNKVSVQLESICQEFSWLSDVWEFVRSWKGGQCVLADEFEVTLNQLYKWQNQFVALPPEILTPYALLCISSSGLAEKLQSTLESIQDQVKSGAILKSRQLCERVLEETKRRTEILLSKRYDLEGFAEYAHHLRECHAFQAKECENIAYVLKIHNILQRLGIGVPKSDKELGRELREIWNSFELKLAEGDEFVAKQTPIKAQGLQENIKSCEEELHTLVGQVDQGDFMDPGQDPNHLIELLDGVRVEVSVVHSRLLGLNKWKEAITGVSHDLSNVNSLLDRVHVRQELWKYRRVFDGYEKQWMSTPFNMLDVNFISSKVTDWLEVCKKLLDTLSKDDPVLTEWRERLDRLKRGMPLLMQLSSKYLKVSHWVTIFAALGEEYDSTQHYTLTDFALYNIYDHTEFIFEICYDAMQGETLKAKVLEIQLQLAAMKINVIQMPLEFYPMAGLGGPLSASSHTNARTSGKRGKSVDGPSTKKGASFALNFMETSSSPSQYLYTMDNHAAILMELENYAIQLKCHLDSPHMGSMRHKTNTLLDTISQLLELMHLLTHCQEGWEHTHSLVKLIQESYRKESIMEHLQKASAKFQDITMSIHDDPRLLSLVDKRRGQKGFRELQGESLRLACNSVFIIMNTVQLKLRDLVDKAIESFPRLCYVSERELLTVMGTRGNPVPILPIISSVFPAINLVRFTEVIPSKPSATTTTASNDEEGFQILFIKDRHKQQLSLCVPLFLGRRPATEWLNGLEYAISYSLASVLSETYLNLPALLKGMEVLTERLGIELLLWLSKHLNQCVLLSMELHWTLVLHSALTSDSPVEQLRRASTKVASASESISEVLLKGNMKRTRPTNLLLQQIILILRQKAELTQSLFAEGVCSVESIHWRSHIQYSTETEDLYTVPDLSCPTVKRVPAAYDLGTISSSTGSGMRSTVMKGHSPMHGVKAMNSNSLVGSCMSISTKNTPVNITGNMYSHEPSRSQVTPGFRTIGVAPLPLRCFIHCYKTSIPYGFEFLGAEGCLSLAPRTESALLSLVHALANHEYPSIKSDSATTGKDLAVVLGRHLHIVDCCALTDPAVLQRLLFGALHTGSLLQMDNVHHLPQLLAIELGVWLGTVSKALTKIPSFAEKHAQLKKDTNVTSSIRSTPGPPVPPLAPPYSQKDTFLNIQTILEQDSPCSHTTDHNVFNIRSMDAQSSTVVSRQSSRLLPSQMSNLGNRSYYSGHTSTRTDWYQLEGKHEYETWFGYGAEARRHVEMEKLHFSSAFGCIFGGDISTVAISEQLKFCFRSVDVVQPELTYLSEALLVSHGFSAAQDLSSIISRFLQQLKHQLSSSEAGVSSSIGTSSLRHIIQHAAQLLLEDNNSRLGFNIESKCIVKSILHFFATQLTTGLHNSDEDEDMDEGHSRVDTTSWNMLKELLGGFFPSYDIDYSYSKDDTSPVPSVLLEAIKTQLQERHLQFLPSLMEKIKQLHLMLSLQGSRSVILTGPSGSGKSTCLKILTAAYQQVRNLHALVQKSRRIGSARGNEQCTYPTVNTVVINPVVYTMDELLGSNVGVGGQSGNLMWHDGILTSILKNIKSSDETRAVTMHPDLNSTASQAIAESGAPVRNWIVLDGLTPLVAGILHRLLTDDGITLKNGETLLLPKSCQLIVECPTLDCATPPLLSSSSLLHYGGDTLSYSALVNTWLERAPTQHNLSLISAETLATMIRQLLPETLEYLETVSTKHHGAEYTTWSRSQVHGLTETQCFLSLLSAVLERNAPKDDSGLSYTASGSHSSRNTNSIASDSRAGSVMKSYSAISVQSEVSSEHLEQPMASKYNIPPIDVDNMSEVSNLDIELSLSLQVQMAAMLAFAYIWSLGAFVPFSEVTSFSELARDLIMQLPYAVPLPDEGSVFDYFLDLKIYHFLPWEERKSESRKSSNSGYVSLPELERFVYIADLYISYGFDVILTGERGTGRTAFVENLLKSRLPLEELPVSHLLTPVQLQVAIKEKLVQLEKKSGQRFLTGSRRNVQKHAFFLDDIHLANMEGSSASPSTGSGGRGSCMDCPVLELLRYMLSHRKLTDFTRCYEHLLNSKFVFTSTPDDYWRLPVRFTRAMCRLPFLPPSDKCLHGIFSCTISPWLEGFPLGDAPLMANALSAASVTVYRSVSERFCPTSLRPHFRITMRHLLSVFEGLLLLSPDTKAQTRPQFGFLNRRGFQSSTQSGKTKLKSGRRNLPSISGRKSLKKRSGVSKEVEQTAADSTLRMLIRLWSHETTRVYLDRNIDSKERMWFLKLLESCIKYCFCGICFEENSGGTTTKERGSFRPSAGHTANIGGGRRTRGNRVPQASVSESLNAEELAGNGVKVETLKQLLAARNTPEEGKHTAAGDQTKANQNPPKLISLDQVTVRGEDLTGLIFAQFPSPITFDDSSQLLSAESASGGLDCPHSTLQLSPGGYAELGDGQVMDVLSKHLESFQSSRGRDCDDEESLSSTHHTDTDTDTDTGGITLYKDAIEHCARLYRVLNLPGAHALLLGSKGTGRKSLLRLMAYIKKSNVIELHSGQHDLKQRLREACISAGLDRQHTLLVVSNHSHFSFQEWNIIVAIMSEGLSPGLFTSSELLVMSGKMHAGKMKRTAQIAYQAFSRAVSMHLHVFVLWDLDSVTGSLFSAHRRLDQADGLTHEASLRALFQSIYQKCAHVDHYQPWSKHAYSEIAMQWWQKESSAVKWQEWTETSSQLETISSLAAHVHIVTSELLTQVYGETGRHLITPKLFIECLTMTQNIAIKIKQKEKAGVVQLETALEKLNAVNKVETALKERLMSLRPRLIASEKEVQDKMHLITSAKERYMEANRRCKVAEETIEYETSNVQRLSLLVENKMTEITPIYQAAIEALSAVKLNDVLEIMKYREPPSLLNPLFNALCMLFDREQSWEECQQLMMTSKFLESLRFFDRDNVPRHKVHKLEKMIGETANFESINTGSKATVSLSKWLHALVDYHKVTMAIEPLKKELAIAEETLTNAKRTFVAMQKDMLETKVALENTIKLHKDSIKQSRRIEGGIQTLGVELSDAQGVVNALAVQRNKWEERLGEISSRIASVPGHAMLCAAGVLYLSRSPPDRHKEMLDNWLGYCSGAVPLGSLKVEQNKLQSAQGYGAFSGQQQVVSSRMQKDFSLAAFLSEKEERSMWNQESTFPDESILDRYLSSRALCVLGTAAWPLVFDPYDQLEKYLRVSGDISNSEVHALGLSDPYLMDVLRMAVVQGSTVLLHMDDDTSAVKYSEEDVSFLGRLLKRDFDKSTGKESLFDAAVNPNLQVYMVIRGTINSVQGSDGTVWLSSHLKILLSLDSYVVDIELKEAALEKNLLNVVIAHERPDHQISYKSFLTDLALHEDELEASKDRMLKYVLDTKNDSLLLAKDLLDTISKCEAAELAAQEQIREAKKNLHVSSQQVVPYKSLSQYAGSMLRSIQKLSAILQYFSLGVNDFERILSDVISKYKSTKVSDNTLSIKAHVIHLKWELMLRVYQNLQMHMFEKHQLLFPLLVALEMKKDQGEITPRELELLGRDMGDLDSQLDAAGDSNKSNLASKPRWVTDKSWCKALKIQKEIVAFRRLCTEVSSSSTEWREYFEMPPCIMAPVPGFGRNCSIGQKILLWKVFKPEKFYAVIKDFILVTAGDDFIKTNSPSLEEILAETKPATLTLLLQSPDSPDHSLSVSALRETALYLHIDCKHFCAEGCNGVLNSLPVLASRNCWVVLEYCHLLPNCHELLTALEKKLKVLGIHASQFHVWVLMPAQHISKCPPSSSSCKMMTFQSPKISSDIGDREQSAQILQDFENLITSTSNQRGRAKRELLISHHPTLSKLKAFLPPVVSESDLVELDPQHNSLHALPSLINRELRLHNQHIVWLHASLELMLSFLESKVPFTASIGVDVMSVAADAIPPSWTGILPKPLSHMTSLMSTVKLLNARVAFYKRTLQSGTLPSKLNPLLFSTPQDLISSRACSFALECQISVSNVMVEGKLHAGEVLERYTNSLILFGLSLSSATWDRHHSCLSRQHTEDPSSSGSMDRNSYCAVISFRSGEESAVSTPAPDTWKGRGRELEVVVEEEEGRFQFDCPVLLTNRNTGSNERKLEVSHPALLFHVPLALSAELSESVVDKVYLSCDSEYHDTYM